MYYLVIRRAVALKLPNFVSSGDTREVRKLYDTIETHTSGLQGLRVNAESYGSFLVPILLSKPPEDIKLVVSRQIEGEHCKLDKLLEILKSKLVNVVHLRMLITQSQNQD